MRNNDDGDDQREEEHDDDEEEEEEEGPLILFSTHGICGILIHVTGWIRDAGLCT